MVSKTFGVNTSVSGYCIDVCQKRFAEVTSQSLCLALVKAISGDQVFPRLRQDFDPHEV